MSRRYDFSKRTPLPPGYHVRLLDSGHFMWVREVEGDPNDWTLESSIHWDRWAAWRGAWTHFRKGEAP